jgi:hypothetical protein
MALKRNFTDEEQIGLTQEELKVGLKYLRKHKTAGVLPDTEALKLYEMYMIGCSLSDIHKQYPQYEVGKIILTAAIKKWGVDRDGMQITLKDRVQAKIVKSVIEQVDFLTSMLEVTSVEHITAMRNFILDPDNNPKPSLRIQSLKEYKDIMEALQKLVAGTPNNPNKPSMLGALSNTTAKKKKMLPKKNEEEIVDLDDIEIDDGSSN